MSNSTSSSGGIGFAGLLAIVFIALKLTGVINWSWLWVLSPLWIVFALFLTISLLLTVAYVIFDETRTTRKRLKNRKL